MSPNMLLVTITSNISGARTICIVSASTNMWKCSMPGYSFATSSNVRSQRSPPKRMTLFLSDMQTDLRPVLLRELEGVADDPLDALARGDVLLHRDLVGRPLLEVAAHADVGAFRVLAEDDEVDVVDASCL